MGREGRASAALRTAIACLATAVGSAAGCGGSGHPPLLGDGIDSGAPADANPIFGFDGMYQPPDCNVGPEAGVCGCLDLPLALDPPNLYFVLDRSGSMNDANKWFTVRSVLAQVMLKLGPRANFGAAVFPDPNGDNCVPGIQVSPVRPGDSPAGTYGPTLRTMAVELNLTASGGTPTAATFSALTPTITALPGRTFAILATDGGPNCDPNATCNYDQCQINIEYADPNCPPQGPTNCCVPGSYGPGYCNDGPATAAAIAALTAAGVPTYVIGVPGSAAYAAVLDSMAQAGGTARSTEPLYYAVDTTDEASLLAALQQIAAKVTATCTLPLAQPPPDPNKVNVYLDDVVVPREPVNGWTLSGSVVTLVGSSCQKVLDGDVLSVRVIAGCPSVLQ